ncbi:hypothetical protein NT01EI_3861 [Edwardsiella ictaluri 93-146]|uniref:Uncharacterized protein n=1 Tax=Edwardsiella ictaluri (strain 93-146) TaxID=634503 RepID=C5BC74_EDWI9|nr:hypothetical protein NT01EI_3861 [Edwardsiella ictaluri 93-146]
MPRFFLRALSARDFLLFFCSFYSLPFFPSTVESLTPIS